MQMLGENLFRQFVDILWSVVFDGQLASGKARILVLGFLNGFSFFLLKNCFLYFLKDFVKKTPMLQS